MVLVTIGRIEPLTAFRTPLSAFIGRDYERASVRRMFDYVMVNTRTPLEDFNLGLLQLADRMSLS